MADKVIPNYRIKRILEIDEHVPRMNKKALTVLAKSLKIFLQEYAKDIHKHIVNTGSSYPVKTKHVVNVSFDPRFIKYEFLTHARKIIEAHEDELEPINKLIREESEQKQEESRGERVMERESGERREMNRNRRINEQTSLNTRDNLNGIKSTLKRKSKTEQMGGDKKKKQSILSYFTPK